MPNVPLCRMRRTCSQMNSLIEENKKKLAKRARMGLKMRIVPYNVSLFSFLQILLFRTKFVLKKSTDPEDSWLKTISSRKSQLSPLKHLLS